MPKHKLQFKSSLINYYVYGNGDKILFCLHGYGEDGSSFSFLEKYLGSVYTLYAPDFPFHGETEWKENEPLSAENILDIFNLINTKNNNSFSVLAYSMGGRVGMHILQQVYKNIEQIVLVAPDGLYVNFWYWLSTQTAIGNKLFEKIMKQPRWFFMFLNAAGKTNILNKSIVKFVHHFLDDKDERMHLYKRWTIMQKFKPDLSSIKKICAEKNIPLHFLFGSFDRIILSKRAAVFKNARNIHIKVIDAGHQLLKEKYASYIASLLYD